MKIRHYSKLVVLALVGLGAATTKAEDTESLAYYIAYHCALSSGNPIENYMDYGRKFEKTLEKLSEEQEIRIFGYSLKGKMRHDAENKSGNTNASGGENKAQKPLKPNSP